MERMNGALVLSCDGCIVGPSDRCADCLVTAVCDGPTRLDGPTARAIGVLQGARLVPPLRRVVPA